MRDVRELEDRLSQPSAALIEDLGKLDGDILVLGAGGKLGPSLVTLAARAVDEAGTGARVIAVSRFGDRRLPDQLAGAGATVIAADITDEAQLAGLPDAPNVVFLVGVKFGTTGDEDRLWLTNSYLPGRVADRFAGARLVGLSTGMVYPMATVLSGGCTEDTPPEPVGEYAMSCLGRERVLRGRATENGSPLALIRLNYAVEMRYGVLLDIAHAVATGEPIDLTMGHANLVWQRYANEVTLRAFHHAAQPPFVVNVTGPETASIRWLATEFGRLLGAEPVFTGGEAGTSVISNASRCHRLFGYPDVTLPELVDWTAAWVKAGLPRYDKPTHFQRRDGSF